MENERVRQIDQKQAQVLLRIMQDASSSELAIEVAFTRLLNAGYTEDELIGMAVAEAKQWM